MMMRMMMMMMFSELGRYSGQGATIWLDYSALCRRTVGLSQPPSFSTCFKLKLKLKLNKALNENSSLSYGASPAIWDHTVLPATRHK